MICNHFIYLIILFKEFIDIKIFMIYNGLIKLLRKFIIKFVL